MVGLIFFSVLTDGGTILNGLRFALAMYSGKNIFISRLLRPAGRNKRIFTEGAVKENGKFSHREVVYGWDFSREKVVQKHPQVFLNHKLKIIFPLKMARAQRRPFQSFYAKGAAARNVRQPLFV